MGLQMVVSNQEAKETRIVAPTNSSRLPLHFTQLCIFFQSHHAGSLPKIATKKLYESSLSFTLGGIPATFM